MCLGKKSHSNSRMDLRFGICGSNKCGVWYGTDRRSVISPRHILRHVLLTDAVRIRIRDCSNPNTILLISFGSDGITSLGSRNHSYGTPEGRFVISALLKRLFVILVLFVDAQTVFFFVHALPGG